VRVVTDPKQVRCKECLMGHRRDNSPTWGAEAAPKKVDPAKRLKAEETLDAIDTFHRNFKAQNKDGKPGSKAFIAWAEKYGEAFEAEAPKHPEWRSQQVEKELERIRVMINGRRYMAAPKTHKMIPGDHRTYCGKTPGLTLKADAPMDDLPTCRGCETGEWTAKARAIEQAHPLPEPAKALAATEKANKRSKGTNAMPAATAATTGLVKMARIGNTNEFGVFPESCWKCTTANALRIGTRQVCEAERDRINATRPAKNDSVENLVANGDAHQNEQQHPAAEALEKALDSTEAVEVSDEQHDEEQCDYSEEQVAPMFAQGSELPEL
jgi:hypothetical protein